MNSEKSKIDLSDGLTIEGYFEVMDFAIARGDLLIRAIIVPQTDNEPETDDEIAEYHRNSYNIDMIFSNVCYMNIPTYFRNVTIKLIKQTSDVCCNYFASKGEIFELKTEENIFYIVSDTMGIFTNHLPQEETSLIVKRESDFPYELLYYHIPFGF